MPTTVADVPPFDVPLSEPAAIDLARVRRDLQADAVCHFDNAGASPTPAAVHDRMVRHLERERAIGGYAAAREVEDELDGFYASAAALIGAAPDEIAFADSATRAWDMLFYAVPFAPGDRILTGRSEYVSNALAMRQVAQRHGVTIETVPDRADGTLDPAALAGMLDPRVKLVSLCQVPTSNGLRNDAEAVGAVLRGHPALYLLDACQSVGQIAIDVRRIGCHMLACTGRKFLRGPRGTGFLYVDRTVLPRLDPPFVDMRAAHWAPGGGYTLRDDARRFESWEMPVAAKLGLKAAIDYAAAIGMEAIEARITALAATLRGALADVPGVAVLDRGTRRSGIVTFRIAGLPAPAARDRLAESGFTVSAIEPCDAPIDLVEGSGGVIRASVHYFNAEEEIDRFVAAVAALAGRADAAQ